MNQENTDTLDKKTNLKEIIMFTCRQAVNPERVTENYISRAVDLKTSKGLFGSNITGSLHFDGKTLSYKSHMRAQAN